MSVLGDPEFSRFVALDELDGGPLTRMIEATDAERAALRARFGLVSLTSLAAKVVLRRLPAGPLVRVEGRLEADVEQRCIVTLEPVPEHIEEAFSETYGPEDYRPPAELDDEDLPESFDDGGIDVGELVAQILSLSLDPYPRAAGTTAAAKSGAASEAESRSQPFAGLDDMLKKRQ